MIKKTLAALGADDISIRINHRGLFNRFLDHIKAAEHSSAILRTVDKLAKIGREETASLLKEILGEERTEAVLSFIEAGTDQSASPRSFDETLARMEEAAGGNCPEAERLRIIRCFMKDTGIESSFILDPSITRGLDYYTGLVCETFLNALPAIGSVCSGGRYDNLAGIYSKENISGVGSSIGLDRLIAALETLGKLPPGKSYAQVIIACVDESNAGLYQALAGRFREKGIPCEALLEGSGADGKGLTKQFVLAGKKGAKWLVIPGDDVLAGHLTLRDLEKRENKEGLSFEETAELVT
jgi:histidyl-tRNA synthetase